MSLKKRLVRLAYSKPELRPHLLPILTRNASRDWNYGSPERVLDQLDKPEFWADLKKRALAQVKVIRTTMKEVLPTIQKLEKRVIEDLRLYGDQGFDVKAVTALQASLVAYRKEVQKTLMWVESSVPLFKAIAPKQLTPHPEYGASKSAGASLIQQLKRFLKGKPKGTAVLEAQALRKSLYEIAVLNKALGNEISTLVETLPWGSAPWVITQYQDGADLPFANAVDKLGRLFMYEEDDVQARLNALYKRISQQADTLIRNANQSELGDSWF